MINGMYRLRKYVENWLFLVFVVQKFGDKIVNSTGIFILMTSSENTVLYSEQSKRYGNLQIFVFK